MILLSLLLQVTPVAPIVKGTALPPPRLELSTEEAGVMRPVDAVLRAIERGDGAAVLAATRGDGVVTVAAEGQPVRSLRWAAMAASMKPSTDRLSETLGTPAIEIDGDVAMVWAPYTFAVNGKVTHCGYDHFDVVREGGTWKVLNVTWSKRTTGCDAR